MSKGSVTKQVMKDFIVLVPCLRRETKKKYNEFRVLCTTSIIIYDEEEIQYKE